MQLTSCTRYNSSLLVSFTGTLNIWLSCRDVEWRPLSKMHVDRLHLPDASDREGMHACGEWRNASDQRKPPRNLRPAARLVLQDTDWKIDRVETAGRSSMERPRSARLVPRWRMPCRQFALHERASARRPRRPNGDRLLWTTDALLPASLSSSSF